MTYSANLKKGQVCHECNFMLCIYRHIVYTEKHMRESYNVKRTQFYKFFLLFFFIFPNLTFYCHKSTVSFSRSTKSPWTDFLRTTYALCVPFEDWHFHCRHYSVVQSFPIWHGVQYESGCAFLNDPFDRILKIIFY